MEIAEGIVVRRNSPPLDVVLRALDSQNISLSNGFVVHGSGLGGAAGWGRSEIFKKPLGREDFSVGDSINQTMKL